MDHYCLHSCWYGMSPDITECCQGRLLGYTLLLEKLPQRHGDLYHDCTSSLLVLERDGVPEQRKLTLFKENPRVQRGRHQECKLRLFFRKKCCQFCWVNFRLLSLLLLGHLGYSHDFYLTFIVFVYFVCILYYLSLTNPHSRCTCVDPFLT